MPRRRLDAELVRRGLASGPAQAQAAIGRGLVLVEGAPATNAASMVAEDATVSLREDTRRFASRGGEKLQAALDRFMIDVSGARCLDAGASTGGFTDCLLQAGAAHVVAVDVGYGQLAWELRQDPRVTVLERTNIREVDPAAVAPPPETVVADLSFISLRTVLPHLSAVAAPDARFVLLVKPQFEAAPEAVGRGGVVRGSDERRAALDRVAEAARSLGIGLLGAMASPLPGPAGNVEFLLYGRAGAPPGDVDLEAAVREGEELT